ncbi:MAG: molybdopterin-dependent oxidoreductase [Sulfurovaceae bacterium]|nr:molybdopterin-dependent oxidoreductase [Sulfurovaceae bacterium]
MTKKMNTENQRFFESRRTFLKTSAYTVAGASLAKGVFSTIVSTPAEADTQFSSIPKSLAFYPPHEEWHSFKELDGTDWKRGGVGRNGIESEDNPDGIKVNEYMLVPTICNNCEALCGLTAWVNIGDYKKSKDPRDLKVRKYMGNPLHAGSRGRNCAKGYAVKSQMYDPDRIPFPLKRAPGSKRGEGKWVRTSWDEAMETIGGKMRETLKTGDDIAMKSIMYQVGRPNETGFIGRLISSMGIDGYNSHTNICSAGARQGTLQFAGDDRNSPDWANAKLIFLQSSHAADAGHYFQEAAGLIADARRKGAKLVVLDPRMSNSAGMADLWVPIWPGTEAALYLHLANRVLTGKDKDGVDLIKHDFVKEWTNWPVLMRDKAHLQFMLDQGLIKSMPMGETYNDFIELLRDMYSPFTLDFAAKECKVDSKTLEKLFDMIIEADDKISTFLWRAGTIGHRGGWMNTKSAFFLLTLRGAMAAKPGGISMVSWHEIGVNGKGDAAVVAGKKPGPIDHWNELAYPPEIPLASYELSFMLPHLLMDDEWRNRWNAKGLKIPNKLSVYIPRMYNPVWINPDGFRWIEALKREDKFELTMNLSPTWSETNWYCDYILPTGLAGERHDEHSEPIKPARFFGFRQPVLRTALERLGWKPKDPARATLEAHTKSGLGEIWEELEFWINIMFYHVDPDGSLGIKQYWESKEHPGKPVTVPEWYQAAFDTLPNLKKAAQSNSKYSSLKYPNYEMLRDMGTWLEQDHIYEPHARELEAEDGIVESMEIKFDASTISTPDQNGVVKAKVHDNDAIKAMGVKIGDKICEGFRTPSRKLEIFSQFIKEYHWQEYAMPYYPLTKEDRVKYVHLVSQVHHDFMKNDNEFALNTIYRLPYNIHTRSVNSKHLMEISQNHNPVWINTQDASKLGIKRGDAIKVTISDTVSGLTSGYFIAMAVPTEGHIPGVLSCSHHAGRWKLVNAVEIPGFKEKLGVMGLGAPLYEMSMDGKIGTLKPLQGIKEGMAERKDSWQFKEFNKDLDNIWWDGLSGAWQNAVAPVHPDPVAGNHCWHQKVSIELASKDDKIGDIYVNYENNFKVYKAWIDKLARPLDETNKLRRPKHYKRPPWGHTDKAYAFDITN